MRMRDAARGDTFGTLKYGNYGIFLFMCNADFCHQPYGSRKLERWGRLRAAGCISNFTSVPGQEYGLLYGLFMTTTREISLIEISTMEKLGLHLSSMAEEATECVPPPDSNP